MFLAAEYYIFLILSGRKCQRRYIFNFWRNFRRCFYCTVFYHLSTRV